MRYVVAVIVLTVFFVVAVLYQLPSAALQRATWVYVAVAVAALAVLFVAFLGVALRKRSRRGLFGVSSIELEAERLGLAYAAKPGESFESTLPALPELKQSGKFKHLLSGQVAGRQLVAFSHSYVVHTGQATIQVAHTLYGADAPDWPPLTVTPRSFIARLFVRKGAGPAVDLPEFGRAFNIKTDDEAFAITLLSPEMQRLMLEKPTGLSWRITDGRVWMIYKGGFVASRVERSLDRFGRFWALAPEELALWGAAPAALRPSEQDAAR